MLPDFLLPYSAVDTRNPIFRQMWRHLRLISTEARLRRFNQITLIGIPLTAVLWWLIERIHFNFGYVPPDFSYRLVNFLLLAALMIMLVASFYSIPGVVGMFHSQFHSGYWEALRLTPQYNSTILMAHDAIAQLRIWPFTAIEVGLRLALVVVFTLNSLYTLYNQSADKTYFLSNLLMNGFFWLALVVVSLIGIAIILEPILRTRVIITLHLIVAIYIRNMPLAVVMGITMLTLIHVSQALLLTVIWAMFDTLTGGAYGGFVVIICLVPLVLITILIFSAFYVWLRKFGLALANRSAFRQD